MRARRRLEGALGDVEAENERLAELVDRQAATIDGLSGSSRMCGGGSEGK